MPNVNVGRITGAHGLKGDVKVEVLTDFIDRFQVGRRLRLKRRWVTVERARFQGSRLILKLSGVDSVDLAETLPGETLEAPYEPPELDEDEFLTADLIGLKVVTVEGVEIGVVADVLRMPAHDVIVVGERMIPAVKQFVKGVDLAAGTMTVELIEGM